MPRSPRAPRASAYVRQRAESEAGETARIRERLAVHGLSPRRRFGQNFLIRDDIAERIVDHAHLDPADVAVEIGPGAGALTPRIARRVRHVTAIELDRGLAALLRDDLGGLPGIDLIEGDFLETDLAAIAAAHGTDRLVVVGNIPYNITTPILERIFAQHGVVKRAILLVQKEYAERLAAAAGTPEYGSLTLFARYHALMEPLMRVSAAAFWPRPDVDSMLVRFFLRERPPVEVADEALLFRIIRGSFQMRRKQLMNTLEETLQLGKEKIARLCRQAGVDPQRRGETLTLEEFAKLSRAAAQRQPGEGNEGIG